MIRFLPVLLLFVSFGLIADQCSAQGYAQRQTENGTVAGVSSQGIVIELSSGQKVPVPMNRATTFRVVGKGDAGFVRIGSVVTVNGMMVSPKHIQDASITVHLAPQQTVEPRVVDARSDGATTSVSGVVKSLSPLVIDSMDLMRITIAQGGAGRHIGPPIPGGMITVVPKMEAYSEVALVFGGTPALAAVNDRISVTFDSRMPGIAAAVTVTKAETMSSSGPVVEEQATQAETENPKQKSTGSKKKKK